MCLKKRQDVFGGCASEIIRANYMIYGFGIKPPKGVQEKAIFVINDGIRGLWSR